MKVSVIATVLNEKEAIERLLKSPQDLLATIVLGSTFTIGIPQQTRELSCVNLLEPSPTS